MEWAFTPGSAGTIDGTIEPHPCEGLHGTRPREAIARIMRRMRALRQGRDRRDGRKLGLVVEGGAMRAVLSAGGALALAHLGLTDAFDEVYATSAGVMNASYFLAGQGELGISIYFEELASRRFINPLRFWKVLDIDYVFDRVVTREKPLDVERVRRSPSRLYVAVIDKHTGRGKMIDTSRTASPLMDLLKAAVAMPVFYNRTVEVDARPCMDAGLAIPFPLEQAIANGCTDILVLLTRPPGFYTNPSNWAQRRLFDLICARGNRDLNRTFADGHERYRAACDVAMGRTAAPDGVNVAAVLPEAPELVHRTTVDPVVLHTAATRYGRRVLRIMGEDDSWSSPPPIARVGCGRTAEPEGAPAKGAAGHE